MPRTAIALPIADLSVFARRLRTELAAHHGAPGHLELLNMLARSAGYRNVQHLRAGGAAQAPGPARPTPATDPRRIARIAGHFGPDGRLMRWPGRTGHQALCAWVLWTRLPADTALDERGISDWLSLQHDFGDPALLRRTLVDMHLLSRTRDGRDYRRVEGNPPADLAPLLAQIAPDLRPPAD